MLAVAITFAILAVVAVFLRLLAHRIAGKKLILSDYLIVAAAILAVGLQSVSITGVAHAAIGWGHVIQVIQAYGPEPIILLSKVSSR